MHKKVIASLLVAVVVLGFVGYWLFGQEQRPEPSLSAFPPAQTMAFLAFPGLPQAWSDLRQTKFFQRVSSPAFWETALGPKGYQRLSEGKRHLEQQLGIPLTEHTVGPLLGREFGLALVPRQGGPWPFDAIAYVRVSGTEKLLEPLTRIFVKGNSDLVRETQTVEHTEIVTLRPKGMPGSLSYAFLGTLAVLSTDPAWVIDALKVYHGTTSERLHQLSVFRDLQLDQTASLLAYAYYDTEGIQAQLTPAMPPEANVPPEAWRMLQTTGRGTLKATRAADGIKVEAMALYPANGAPPMFRRTEANGPTPPFAGVPAETFYLTHIDLLDLQGLLKALRQLGGTDQDGFERALARFRQWTGLDLERDVLTTFTGVVGLGITGPLGSQGKGAFPLPGLFLTLGVTDEQKARQLIQTAGTRIGGPRFQRLFKPSPHHGYEILHLTNPLLFVKPGYVISRKQLIVGSDLSLLQHMLDAAEGKTRTLAQTDAYQAMFKHFRSKGGSVNFVDVATVLEKAREWWAQAALLLGALQRFSGQQAPAALGSADFWTLTELLRPIRYVGATSRGEAQGLRTEAFIMLEDPK